MDVEKAGAYYSNMQVLLAREKLQATMISAWPSYSNEDRKRMRKELLKEAKLLKTKKAMSAQDIAKIIGT